VSERVGSQKSHEGLASLGVGVVCLSVPQPIETFILSHIGLLDEAGFETKVLGIYELRNGARAALPQAGRSGAGAKALRNPKRWESFCRWPFAAAAFAGASGGSLSRWASNTHDKRLGWEGSWGQILKQYRAVRYLKGCSLIHAHYGPAGAFCVPVKRKLGVPLVTMFHGFDATRVPREEPGLYEDLWKERDAFLTSSEFIRGLIVEMGAPAEKTMSIGNPLDPERFPFKERCLGPERPMRLLFVGRLVEVKGLPYLIEAVRMLVNEGRRLTLRVVGDGEMRGTLEQQVEKMGLTDVVSFPGQMSHDDVVREMLGCDVFVLPSVTASTGDREGLATVLLEAQLTGVPVVSTDYAGIREAVVNGRTGVLVPEKDSERLAGAIATLMEHPERWGEMGRAGREHVVEQWSTETYGGRLLRVYERLLGRKSVRP